MKSLKPSPLKQNLNGMRLKAAINIALKPPLADPKPESPFLRKSCAISREKKVSLFLKDLNLKALSGDPLLECKQNEMKALHDKWIESFTCLEIQMGIFCRAKR